MRQLYKSYNLSYNLIADKASHHTFSTQEMSTCIIYLTNTQPLPIILVKSTMVQSTGTNNIGWD